MNGLHLGHPDAIRHAQRLLADPAFFGWYMHLRADPNRTLEQNALLWPLLARLEQQLDWPLLVHGRIQQLKMVSHEWKNFLTAHFQQEANRMALGMDGSGLVLVGHGTSGMGKKKFSEFLEFIYAFGAQHAVDLRHPDETPPPAGRIWPA